MIEDRKVKVDSRGRVVYTHDPYKKKNHITAILKKAAAVGLVTGSIMMILCGLGGTFKYEMVGEDIQKIAQENGYEERVDNDFINSKEKMQLLDQYMATSEAVTKEEYDAFLKAKKEAEDVKLYSLAIGVGGASFVLAGLGTMAGASIAEERRFRKKRRKDHDVTKSFEPVYNEDWMSAEIDIPFGEGSTYSIVEKEHRK